MPNNYYIIKKIKALFKYLHSEEYCGLQENYAMYTGMRLKLAF